MLQSDIEEEEVVKGLSQIARDLLDPKFNVKKIYLKEDRKDYISKFPKSSKPKLTKKAPKPWQVNSSTSSSGASPAKKTKANPKDRDTLIPRSCILSISNAKVNAMYHELQKLSLSKYINAAAVSFRVFVELSLDCYLEEHKLKFTGRVFLKDKVNSVTTHLESNGLTDKNICKGIRNEITNKNDLLGIETWHAYVHNAKYRAKPTDLVTTWDNIVHVIEKMWANIK